LNGCVAALYRLSRDDFAHILETFPLVPRDARDGAFGAFEARVNDFS